MEIEVKKVKLSTIHTNPDNPRNISRKDMDLVIKSLQEFPAMLEIREIVVDENMMVLGGNMRMRVLQKRGEEDCTVKIVRGLTSDQKREFIIKDNSQFGDWDLDALANAWSDLPLADWGVDLPEQWLEGEQEEPKDAEPQIDRAEELNQKWQVKPGDLWLIGEHRLLCGDSTKKENVDKAMGGGIPMLMVTDPPYGVSYDPRWREDYDGNLGTRACGKVENDNRADWTDAWILFPGDVAYVWHGALHSLTVANNLFASGFQIRAQIIWSKNIFVFGRGDYHWQHETCWYAVKKGKVGHYIGDRKQSTVWQIENNSAYSKNKEERTGHGTQKPLECMTRPIRNHESEYVYDPFLGSGTTMVACQNLNRKCQAIEITPNYCAVILERMIKAFPEIDIRRSE